MSTSEAEIRFSSTRDELLKLLEEYTEDLKRSLEMEASIDARRDMMRTLFVAVGLGLASSAAVVGLIASLRSEEVKQALPAFVAMAAVVVGVASLIPVFNLSARHRQKRFVHEIQFTARILERIVSRASQLVDHNKSRLDFTFEVRIAEAEAVLDRYLSRDNKDKVSQ